MLTRREVLSSLAAARLCLGKPVSRKTFFVEIWEEPNSLSHESASGFGMLLKRERADSAASIVIAPGIRQLTERFCQKIHERMSAGVWVIVESGLCFSTAGESERQTKLMNSAFHLEVSPPSAAHGSQYVAYAWPHRRLTRTFETVTTVGCGAHESIATFQGRSVCVKKRMGRGGLVYLGSMLGPGLFAEESDAHLIGGAILRSLIRSIV